MTTVLRNHWFVRLDAGSGGPGIAPAQLLAPAHGAPARLYSPVKLGYKNTKYLTQIVFMPHRNGGY